MGILEDFISQAAYQQEKRAAKRDFMQSMVMCMEEENVSLTVAADKVRASAVAYIDQEPLADGETTETRQELMREVSATIDQAKEQVRQGFDTSRHLLAIEDAANNPVQWTGDVAEQIGADRTKDAHGPDFSTDH